MPLRSLALILLALSACGAGAPAAYECAVASALPMGEGGRRVALNAYYLQEEAARAVRLGRTESPELEETMAKARALGATVVRTNAFNDDPAKAGDSAIQIARLSWDETALRGLDLVLARAQAHGVKLVLPLGNYWNAYGGARQYVAWAGHADAVEGDPRFFTDRPVIDHFKAQIQMLLSRVDTVDGIRYGEHPAVLAWELLNEPRGSGLDAEGRQMRAWIDELAGLVKRLAPGHLVGTGEEGFDLSAEGYGPIAELGWRQVLEAPGSSFRLNLASPSIDFGSVHLYPEAWRISASQSITFGSAWIDGHAKVARELGKPLFVGEFGLPNDGVLALAERRAAYRAWFGCARRTGAAGVAPWLFAYDARPDTWDRHTFYFRDGTSPEDPVNRYADLVIEAAR